MLFAGTEAFTAITGEIWQKTATGAFFDDHGPAPHLREALSESAREDIGQPAGGRWNDELHRLRRKALSVGVEYRNREEQDRKGTKIFDEVHMGQRAD